MTHIVCTPHERSPASIGGAALTCKEFVDRAKAGLPIVIETKEGAFTDAERDTFPTDLSALLLKDYGTKWRAWDREPTEAQMDTAWD